MLLVNHGGLWELASQYWSGGPVPKNRTVTYDYYTKDVRFTPSNISIGCQTFHRQEVEYLARQCGWEPVVFEG